MSNNDPRKIISEFLKDLGYKGNNVEVISHKMLEEILDNVLLNILSKEDQMELVDALKNENESDSVKILGKINKNSFQQEFELQAKNSIKDILDKLVAKLSEEEFEQFSPTLEMIENKYTLKAKFADQKPEDILSMLSN